MNNNDKKYIKVILKLSCTCSTSSLKCCSFQSPSPLQQRLLETILNDFFFVLIETSSCLLRIFPPVCLLRHPLLFRTEYLIPNISHIVATARWGVFVYFWSFLLNLTVINICNVLISLIVINYASAKQFWLTCFNSNNNMSLCVFFLYKIDLFKILVF